MDILTDGDVDTYEGGRILNGKLAMVMIWDVGWGLGIFLVGRLGWEVAWMVGLIVSLGLELVVED